MYRLAIYFAADLGTGAEALQDQIADLLRGHALASSAPTEAGYVLALAEVEEPADDDAFVEFVTEGSYRVLLGPRELLGDG